MTNGEAVHVPPAGTQEVVGAAVVGAAVVVATAAHPVGMHSVELPPGEVLFTGQPKHKPPALSAIGWK